MEPKIIPHDNPVRKPWQTSNCQNSLHSAVTKVATTRITLDPGLSLGYHRFWYYIPGDEQSPFIIPKIAKATRKNPREENQRVLGNISPDS